MAATLSCKTVWFCIYNVMILFSDSQGWKTPQTTGFFSDRNFVQEASDLTRSWLMSKSVSERSSSPLLLCAWNWKCSVVPPELGPCKYCCWPKLYWLLHSKAAGKGVLRDYSLTELILMFPKAEITKTRLEHNSKWWQFLAKFFVCPCTWFVLFFRVLALLQKTLTGCAKILKTASIFLFCFQKL